MAVSCPDDENRDIAAVRADNGGERRISPQLAGQRFRVCNGLGVGCGLLLGEGILSSLLLLREPIRVGLGLGGGFDFRRMLPRLGLGFSLEALLYPLLGLGRRALPFLRDLLLRLCRLLLLEVILLLLLLLLACCSEPPPDSAAAGLRVRPGRLTPRPRRQQRRRHCCGLGPEMDLQVWKEQRQRAEYDAWSNVLGSNS